MRLFVAADVPDAAREAIAAEQKRIAAALSDKEREPFPPPLPNRSSQLRRTRRSAGGASRAPPIGSGRSRRRRRAQSRACASRAQRSTRAGCRRPAPHTRRSRVLLWRVVRNLVRGVRL